MTVSLGERLTYDPQEILFFVNFEGYSVEAGEDVRKMEAMAKKILSPLGRKGDAIVNYDDFTILPEIVDAYTEMEKSRGPVLYRRDQIFHQVISP